MKNPLRNEPKVVRYSCCAIMISLALLFDAILFISVADWLSILTFLIAFLILAPATMTLFVYVIYKTIRNNLERKTEPIDYYIFPEDKRDSDDKAPKNVYEFIYIGMLHFYLYVKLLLRDLGDISFALAIDTRGRIPSISIKTHESFVAEKEKFFNELYEELDNEEFVKEVFANIDGLDWIIFNSKVSPEFVQFRLRQKYILFDFPAVNDFQHTTEMDDVVKLLKKHGFRYIQKVWKYKTYKKTKIPGGETISAHLDTDKKLAVDITLEIYKKIFNLSLDDMELSVG